MQVQSNELGCDVQAALEFLVRQVEARLIAKLVADRDKHDDDDGIL